MKEFAEGEVVRVASDMCAPLICDEDQGIYVSFKAGPSAWGQGRVWIVQGTRVRIIRRVDLASIAGNPWYFIDVSHIWRPDEARTCDAILVNCHQLSEIPALEQLGMTAE